MINTAVVGNLSIGRTPEMQAAYQASLKAKREEFGDDLPCPFDYGIAGGLRDDEIIEEHNGIYIARAGFPYAIDNGQQVLEHLLVVPREHVADVDMLPEKRAKAFNDTLTYARTALGMSMMMRSNKDVTKSVLHAHAHFFEYGPKVIFQNYDRELGVNVIFFEGEEEEIEIYKRGFAA